ncbi:MAG: SUMF1/EgtB/PvdO family nonheme iron enzyme, partial [Verrucomicrobiota bacterium]
MKTHTCPKPLKTLALWLLLLATGFAYAADTYLVVDLSGGKDATNYPVSYLDAVPSGGWTDTYKTDKLVLRKIPATTGYTMGSPAGELGRQSDETQHEVTLTKDFYMGVFEVTQRQWELVMGNRPSYFTNAAYYATRPVENVSYYDIRENPANSAISPHWPATNAVHANSFMGTLRAKTGLAAFDLPTESQWEYACRAGTITALNSGSNLTGTTTCPNMAAVGRYWDNGGSGYSQSCAPSAGTATAGSYLPNAWGLYDMHGNVCEFCLDWYGTYSGTVSDPGGAASGSYRVMRGGCLYYAPHQCRSASRSNHLPFTRSFNFGFRIAGNLSVLDTVTLHPGAHGSIAGANSGTDYVTTVSNGAAFPAVTVNPAAGYTFTGWSPSAPATVTADFEATAQYATDTDGDGLPDAWEQTHFGNLNQGPTDDFDHDGRTNAEELADNTDPANAGSTLGLVAYYPFDENANDASGNGNNGMLGTGESAPLLTTDRFGVSNKAYSFDGNDIVVVARNASLEPSQITISLWVNISSSSNLHQLVRKELNNGSGYDVRWEPPYGAFSIKAGGSWDGATFDRSLVPVGEWKQLTCVYDQTNMMVYINGILRGTKTHSRGGPIQHDASDLWLGLETYSARCLQGKLDDIRIYNRAISSNEVARLYASTAQPTTHTVTLHPGAHGSIAGANSGNDYVTTVAHGAAFPAVTVSPAAGYTFTGWNPTAPAMVTSDFTATAQYAAVPLPDLTLTSADLRILSASGAETSNPAIGEAVTLEVTVRNSGTAPTAGIVQVRVFENGSPTDLTSYNITPFTVAASGEVAQSIPVGGSQTVLIPWPVSGLDRVATLTAVAEFAANRAQSQANAAGASLALPVAEALFSNNSAGGAIQIGLPAGEPGNYGIAVTASAPAGMVSGVSYTLSGTAAYDWGSNEPVLGALVTVTVNGTNYTGRTVAPDGAWSVALNGLPAGTQMAHVVVDDGRLIGFIDLALSVSGGAATIDLHITQMGFDSGIYRAEGETGHAVTGGNVLLKALVRNDGNTPAGAFAVAFKNPAGGVICTVPVAGLAAFGQTWVTATSGWAAVAGTSVLSAQADSAGAVTETN